MKGTAMGVRKNAKFLTAVEREDFVKACVLLKAEIVNPGAPVADQYSRWDELTGLHRMIQNAFSPLGLGINFGHGGLGSYSFLSWHRYFLLHVERLLQGKVPGVMIPYWDWTDPASLMTETFIGPNGDLTGVIRRGYFAATAPGVGANTTPAPSWWPEGFTGWQLPPTYTINGGQWIGPLRRRVSTPATLPSAFDMRDTLDRTTYSAFQRTLENGNGLASGNQMHNGMHGWIGGSGSAGAGHMSHPDASPHDPFFYLHHCNIDRLWAMWQADGHTSDYPTSGGRVGHHRNDIMYPWIGSAAGFGTNVTIGAIAMPDFTALGVQRNVDTLDHRALGYTFDTMPIVGIELDRSGSMTGVTPDPMTTSAPAVAKWVAATRGVSAFLQDCEVARSSGVAYITAGVRDIPLAGRQRVRLGVRAGAVRAGQDRHTDQQEHLRRHGIAARAGRGHTAGRRVDGRIQRAGRSAGSPGGRRAALPQSAHGRHADQRVATGIDSRRQSGRHRGVRDGLRDRIGRRLLDLGAAHRQGRFGWLRPDVPR